ncbi:MAG: alpha/beta hydrolase [Bacteroidota bacterium]
MTAASIKRLLSGTINGVATVSPNLAGKLAFEMFKRPVRVRGARSRKSIEVLGDAATDEVAVNGQAHRRYRWGTPGQPTILLAHGWSSNTAVWARFIPELIDAGFHLIGVDATGHGDSEGRKTNPIEYAAVLRAAAPEARIIMGHSFGGFASAIAASDALEAGEQPMYRGLVLIGAPFGSEVVLRSFSSELTLNRKATHGLVREFEAEYGALETLPDVAELTGSTSAQVLVIHDTDDVEIEPEPMFTGMAGQQRVELYETQGLGHRRIMRSAEVIERAVAFCRRVVPVS